MKHIGIVACSAEGAALCYRTIAQEAERYCGKHNHPTVTMHSVAMAKWMPAFHAADYAAVGELMLESVNVLAEAGAEFALCPDNSCHLSWSHFIERSPIPWLHIGEAVAAEARRRGFVKAGLLGTRFTMTGSMYPEVFRRNGMEIVSPSEQDQEFVHRIIFEELVRGKFPEESRLQFNQVIARLKSQGCDCAILGCTEIPLLVRPDDCPLPTLDSTRLLAKAAVAHATADSNASAVRKAM